MSLRCDRNRVLVAVTCVMGLLLAGCEKPRPKLADVVRACGDLPGVRHSQHPGLRAELRDVETGHGLPDDLQQPPIPDDKNAATLLLKSFAASAEFDKLTESAAAVLKEYGKLEATPWYTGAEHFLADYKQQLIDATKASLAPECQYPLDYRQGYFSDMHYVDATAAACQLQLIAAALATRDDDLTNAVNKFNEAAQWCDWLDTAGPLEARMQAARLRRQMFAVLAVLVNDERMDSAKLIVLAERLERSLSKWPSDKALLMSERSLNMHAYELVRQGLIEMLLTTDERRVLREEGVIEDFRKADKLETTQATIDADEAAYLRYMQQVLGVAEEPYFARASKLREFDRQLAATATGKDYAWLATRVFTSGLSPSQADLARCHAQMLAWHAALEFAAGNPTVAPVVSPLNGVPLKAEVVGEQVVVKLDDRRAEDAKVRVPRG